MHNPRKYGEAAQRFAERRQREDSAPRLAAEIPDLLTLELEIEERVAGNRVAEPSHIRRVVVESAPALFVLRCGDPRCKDGGHEVTDAVLRRLRSRETRFEGSDECN